METFAVSHTAALLLGSRLARVVLGNCKAAAEEQKMSWSPNLKGCIAAERAGLGAEK